jgi:hypothetical protein
MKRSEIDPMPEYFDRYINLVADIELSEAFAENIGRLDELDKDLLEKLGDKSYAAGKWTVREILQHIIDWERILTYRSLLFARRENTIPPGHDEALLTANANAGARTVDELIAELKIVGASTAALFASFDQEALNSQGKNWDYEISALAMGFIIVGHQRHHLKIIEDKYFRLADQYE